jgi:anti-anti-sigma factor
VLVRVGDSGAWRPPPADPGYRGRGLQIIRAVAVDVELTHGPQGTRIAFVVPPPPTGTLEQTPKRHPAPPQADAVVAVTRSGELMSVSIVGELDLAGADALRDRLVTIVAEAPDGGRIVLDLRDTGYVASAGVALLLDTVEQAERRGLTVEATMHPHGAVARILALTGVGALLGVAVPAQPSESTSIVT